MENSAEILEENEEKQDLSLISEEELQKRHRKEKKELQNKITNLKHSLNKSDKKAKKELLNKISDEENQLEVRQKAELDEFRRILAAAGKIELSHVTENVSNLSVNNENMQNNQKISKAQKRREAKEQMAKSLETRLAQADQESANGDRELEKRTLDQILLARNLKLIDIAPDGDCLYNAISHQLKSIGLQYNVMQLRDLTCDTIKKHKDEFLPFLITGQENIDEKFDEYCAKISANGVWGGEPELKALSIGLERPIEILQADGKSIIIGNYTTFPPLIITYHKYAFNLGEHYNSTEQSEKSII